MKELLKHYDVISGFVREGTGYINVTTKHSTEELEYISSGASKNCFIQAQKEKLELELLFQGYWERSVSVYYSIDDDGIQTVHRKWTFNVWLEEQIQQLNK